MPSYIYTCTRIDAPSDPYTEYSVSVFRLRGAEEEPAFIDRWERQHMSPNQIAVDIIERDPHIKDLIAEMKAKGIPILRVSLKAHGVNMYQL